jgi:hypothetical protein
MASPAHHARDSREEAAMAAIAFNVAEHKNRIRGALESRLIAPGEMAVDETMSITAQFQPLDPGIVNETIPAFFIGRNKEGFWVARDVKGRIGGIFLLEDSAVSFARRNSLPSGCATIYPSERFELDLENNGNPLVAPLGPLMRLSAGLRRRMTAFIEGVIEATRR